MSVCHLLTLPVAEHLHREGVWHGLCLIVISGGVENTIHHAYGKTKKTTITNLYSNLMKIKPLADRVLIKPTPAEETTISGIIIPDSAKEKPLRGTVLATGDGTKDEKMVVKEGDTVLYGKYAGTEVELDGEKLLIMRQSDILGIFE